MLMQCIDSLVQKVQSGVVINFEKIGPDPPPIDGGNNREGEGDDINPEGDKELDPDVDRNGVCILSFCCHVILSVVNKEYWCLWVQFPF